MKGKGGFHVKKWLILLIAYSLVLTGCAGEDPVVAEPTAKVPEEPVAEADSFTMPGEVFLEQLQGFDEGIPDDWKVVKYVTLEEDPLGVYAEDGIIRLVAEETDRVPLLYSTPVDLEDARYLAIKARLKTTYGNEYYTGAFGVWFTDQPELVVEADPDGWANQFGRRLTQTEYVNYFSNSSKRIVENGFVFYTASQTHGSQAQAFETGIFDEWFEQVFLIDLESGETVCWINGEQLEGLIDLPQEQFVRLWLHPYGWYTGHELAVDSVEILLSR